MNIQERIALIIKLCDYMKSDTQNWKDAKEMAYQKNGWFTPEFCQQAALEIAENYLNENDLNEWVVTYQLNRPIAPKNIGIVMAGNIPLVGFHDMLAVFMSGHHQTIKLSSKDDVLLKHLIQFLAEHNPAINTVINFEDSLKNCDAYIATGGSNAAKTFEEYFGKYPSIIRKNKTSIAILSGNETDEDLLKLSHDIHAYFGLGCRNVTKLYVPENYNFEKLLASFKSYTWFADHHKYKNNYDYQLSIVLLNNLYYMTNEATLLIENKGIFSPISQVFYEFYSDEKVLQQSLKSNLDIQCIVGINNVPFGSSQKPGLNTYADGVDSMNFLVTLQSTK